MQENTFKGTFIEENPYLDLTAVNRLTVVNATTDFQTFYSKKSRKIFTMSYDQTDKAFPLDYMETSEPKSLQELQDKLEDARENLAHAEDLVDDATETEKAEAIKEFKIARTAVKNAEKAILKHELSENKRICAIDTTHDELGIDAIAKKLGEGFGKRPQYYKVNGERINTNPQGISKLDAIIFNESQFTGQGEPCLEHETRTPRAWFNSSGTIRLRLSCTQAQAESLGASFAIIEPDYRTAKSFLAWIQKSGIEKAIPYFKGLADELSAVSMTEQPRIFTQLIEDENKGATDLNGDTEFIKAEAYHLLDDPKDEVYANHEDWYSRQNSAFKSIMSMVRSASTLKELGKIGKATFGKDLNWFDIMNNLGILTTVKSKFTKTQANIFWSAYNGRKHFLTPKYSELALKACQRIGSHDCDLKQVSAWLHGKALKVLAPYEVKMLWSCWHSAKKDRQPKQTTIKAMTSKD